MIDEGAGFKNTLAFYSYPMGNYPTNENDVDLTIVFPNASLVGSGGSLNSSNNSLLRGDKVCIGEDISAETEIAFCLFQNAFTYGKNKNKSGTINYGANKFYTNYNLNPEYNISNDSAKNSLAAHNVVFWDNDVKKYVLGFEDIVRPGGDNDFNDCLFYITMDPLPLFVRDTTVEAPPILPVNLINFEATYSNNNIILNWVTASEYNNDGFEIQRSTNNKDFETIGFEKGNGVSNILIRYSFLDNNIENGETYYYRLKQIDYDGKFAYSNIQSAQLSDSELLLSSYPNPIENGGKINFKLSSDNNGESGTINFYSIDGQLIINKDINYTGKKYFDQIDTRNLNSGIYILEFRNKFQVIQNKIIIK
jgi:hypothetical protein